MKRGISNKLKIEILNYLAESLSFEKTIIRFPKVSIENIREILNQSAAFYKERIKSQDSLDLHSFSIYTDGASRGNPGKAGAGVVILDKEGNIIKKLKKYLGNTTNNSSEYQALILGLTEVLKLGGKRVNVFSDSELMIKQLKGIYKVKSKRLTVLYNEVSELLKKFVLYDIKHIGREENQHADMLANKAIDEGSELLT